MRIHAKPCPCGCGKFILDGLAFCQCSSVTKDVADLVVKELQDYLIQDVEGEYFADPGWTKDPSKAKIFNTRAEALDSPLMGINGLRVVPHQFVYDLYMAAAGPPLTLSEQSAIFKRLLEPKTMTVDELARKIGWKPERVRRALKEGR